MLFNSWAQPSSENIIYGSVIDYESQLPIAFSHIYVPNDSTGVYSNIDGSFKLKVPTARKIALSVSCLGYETKNIEIDVPVKKDLLVSLVPKALISKEVVITSSKKLQSIALSPASIEVLNASDALIKNINTFDQLLEEANGIQLTRSSGSNVQAVSIRGSSEVAGGGIGNRVLLLIDGRPSLSPESGGALWNLIPINSVERIEILKGAYSSLYGSSAVGGVINVITKKPSNQLSSYLNSSVGVYEKAPKESEYDEIGGFYKLGIGMSNKNEKLGYIIDLNYQFNEGHREKSSFDLLNLYGKLDFPISKTRSLQVSANVNSINNDTPASWLSARQAYSVAEYKKDDYQFRNEIAFDLNYHSIPNATTKYSNNFYFYRNYSEFDFNEDPGNDSTNVNIGKQTVDFETVSANRFGSTNQIDFFKGKHYLIGGIDLQYDFINGTPDTVLYGKHNSIASGIFIQDEFTINSKTTLTTGIRYDYFNILGEFAESNLSPKLSLVYRPNESISFRSLYAKAFRNPSIAERFIKFEQGGGLRFVPNPELVSEKLMHSIELGALWQPNKKLKLDFALYYNRYNDLISFQQQPVQGFVFKVVNLKAAEMKGFDVNASYQFFNNLGLKLSYNYLDAQDVSEGRFNDDLAYKIKHSFNYSITSSLGPITMNVYGKYKSAVEEVFIYPGSEPESFWILNFKVGLPITKHLYGSFGANNIGNTLYEELERYRMPGRNYALSLKLKWE